MKFLRRYLFHIQKSVFQGTLTPRKFIELQEGVKKLIDNQDDQVIFFFTINDHQLKTVEYGKMSRNRFII